MSEWKEYNITEVCDTISDTYRDGAEKVVLINTSDVLEGVVTNHEYVPNKNLAGQFKKKFQKDDILYSEIRPANKRYAYVDFEPQDYIASTKLMVLRSKPCVLPKYLYYLLTNNTTIRNLHAIAVGRSGTFPQITYSELANIKFKLPSINEQKEILSALLDFDDKIAVNKKICDNLEAQAQALFKHWFVDFAPFKDGNFCANREQNETCFNSAEVQPKITGKACKFVESELGLIPEGWRVVSLDELMDYSGGSQPPASEFVDEEREGYIRFVQIRDYASDSHITYIPESKKNKLCDVKDIMIARYGVSLGRICYGLKGAYNVALAKVFPTKDYYLEFLRCYLNTTEFYKGINMKGNRAVQAGFNKSDIQSFTLPFPTDESIVLMFNDICSSLFEKRLSNEQESRRLATLRNTLLPKLMSGQIKL